MGETTFHSIERFLRPLIHLIESEKSLLTSPSKYTAIFANAQQLSVDKIKSFLGVTNKSFASLPKSFLSLLIHSNAEWVGLKSIA